MRIETPHQKSHSYYGHHIGMRQSLRNGIITQRRGMEICWLYPLKHGLVSIAICVIYTVIDATITKRRSSAIIRRDLRLVKWRAAVPVRDRVQLGLFLLVTLLITFYQNILSLPRYVPIDVQLTDLLCHPDSIFKKKQWWNKSCMLIEVLDNSGLVGVTIDAELIFNHVILFLFVLKWNLKETIPTWR